MPSICLHSCDLVLKTNNDAVIRGVVVFGEQIFEEESLFLYPRVREQDVTLRQHPPALYSLHGTRATTTSSLI